MGRQARERRTRATKLAQDAAINAFCDALEAKDAGAARDSARAVAPTRLNEIGNKRFPDPIYQGVTMLHKAAHENRPEMVDVLIGCGAELSVVTRDNGRTPLWMAASDGHTQVVRVLCAKGAAVNLGTSDVNISPLFIAAQNGHCAVVELLIAEGADVTQEATDGWGNPLLRCVKRGQYRTAKMLIAAGAMDEDTGEVVLATAESGETRMVKLVLDKGASISNRNRTVLLPMMAAMGYEFEEEAMSKTMRYIEERRLCIRCGTTGKVQHCGKCNASYCSRECQKSHWAEHKLVCNEGINSTDATAGISSDRESDSKLSLLSFLNWFNFEGSAQCVQDECETTLRIRNEERERDARAEAEIAEWRERQRRNDDVD